nr:MAG TPA: hypothetical protein [Caudoviricetes sp.]DAX54504.1 MAG TPA: hypothetical protein [Caudoviricetes sp.]
MKGISLFPPYLVLFDILSNRLLSCQLEVITRV